MANSIEVLIEKAKVAQARILDSSQEQIDSYVRAIGKIIYDHAEVLAKEAIDETQMGRYEDKVMKNKGKSKMIWRDLQGKKSVGIIKKDDEKRSYVIQKNKKFSIER